ncbi:MAG TPA: TRAP transporter TatT component family protein [Vicinamibacterales bacterium]
MGLLMLAGVLTFPAAAQTPASADPDALYAAREHLPDARAAAAIWQQRLDRNPGDFEAAWKLARAGYFLGGRLPDKDARIEAFESGMAAARAAIAARPDRPEGYFWLAATMGGLAELRGLGTGLRYRGAIRDNLERVLTMDPGFQKGSADRALGRWYFKVPRLFGGSRRKAEAHLRASLARDPDSIASRFFLAEVLEAEDRDEEAAQLLREILALPIDPEWAPEDRDFKARAQAMLAELQAGRR